MPYIREDQADIRVTVDGVEYFGSWSTYDGAGLEAQDDKTRPGGMGSQVSVGGPAERDDLECTIAFSDIVSNSHSLLESKVGWARVSIKLGFLGPNKVPTGKSHSVKGILKSAKLPTFDSNGNATSFYSISASLDETAA